ncbi:hypothetical protein [Shimia sp. Alg240-R146]|uniref:hypothetical protein n=1 Tax=Shimia sp. Alg240-R146 TaxID=2993449 RepID=UPI0022E5F42E|nr:hypothetical protein [Shimia sp. Alg240-R146]
MKYSVLLLTCVALAGCDLAMPDVLKRKPETAASTVPSDTSETRPVVRPETTDEGDETDRAVAAPGSLGRTVVSLGDAAEAGSWLKTPLVATTRPGRVTHKGKWVAVTLIPIDGASGAGSRMSLQAMHLLGLPLTELTEVEVIAQ